MWGGRLGVGREAGCGEGGWVWGGRLGVGREARCGEGGARCGEGGEGAWVWGGTLWGRIVCNKRRAGKITKTQDMSGAVSTSIKSI